MPVRTGWRADDRPVHDRCRTILQYNLDRRVGFRAGISIGGHDGFHVRPVLSCAESLDGVRVGLVDQDFVARAQVHGEPLEVRATDTLPPEQPEGIVARSGDDKIERGVRGAAAAVVGTEQQPEWIGRARSHGDLESIVAVHSHPIATRIQLKVGFHLRDDVIDGQRVVKSTPRIGAGAGDGWNRHVRDVLRRRICGLKIADLCSHVCARPARLDSAVPVDVVNVDHTARGGHVGKGLAVGGIEVASRPLLLRVHNRVFVGGNPDEIDLINLGFQSGSGRRARQGVGGGNGRVIRNREVAVEFLAGRWRTVVLKSQADRMTRVGRQRVRHLVGDRCRRSRLDRRSRHRVAIESKLHRAGIDLSAGWGRVLDKDEHATGIGVNQSHVGHGDCREPNLIEKQTVFPFSRHNIDRFRSEGGAEKQRWLHG